MNKKIEAVPDVRDDYGIWSHPNLTGFDEDDVDMH